MECTIIIHDPALGVGTITVPEVDIGAVLGTAMVDRFRIVWSLLARHSITSLHSVGVFSCK
ncbi:hypothetical protein ElyMa_004945900 [Elysia marginata]|uniref:Uncharacterized protein n=1 Tax=Elysia marginata TaxID=1093978 RepID=A0AAV4J217_9GAST|nr:hypothetical protein ElyMa_004945900 [Elysia marginata]